MREIRTVFHGTDLEDAPDSIIELTSVIWREGDDWVAECVELGVSSFGSSDEEAYDELMDAVCAYLNTLEELGERQQVFDRKGVPVYLAAPTGAFHPNVPRDMVSRESARIRPMSVPVRDSEAVATPA